MWKLLPYDLSICGFDMPEFAHQMNHQQGIVTHGES